MGHYGGVSAGGSHGDGGWLLLAVGCWSLGACISTNIQRGQIRFANVDYFVGLNNLDWSKFYLACPETLAKIYSIFLLDQI